MFNSDKMESRFQEFAEQAAQLERKGNYRNAAFAWMGCVGHAHNPANRHWAKARSDFCHAWGCRLEKEHEVAA